jgi:hypothetical protein
MNPRKIFLAFFMNFRPYAHVYKENQTHLSKHILFIPKKTSHVKLSTDIFICEKHFHKHNIDSNDTFTVTMWDSSNTVEHAPHASWNRFESTTTTTVLITSPWDLRSWLSTSGERHQYNYYSTIKPFKRRKKLNKQIWVPWFFMYQQLLYQIYVSALRSIDQCIIYHSFTRFFTNYSEKY